MKNYIWNSINTDNIKGDKPLSLKKVKFKLNKKTTKERKRARKPKRYKTYIKSNLWLERKNKYYQLYRKKCHICSSSKYIQLHHLEYRQDLFGKEKDEMLVPLCREHHEEFHLRYTTKQKMYKEFDEFVELLYKEYMFR